METKQPDSTVARLYKKNLPFKLNFGDKKEKMITPSWEESRKHAEEAMKWIRVLDGLAKDMAVAYKKTEENLFEAFRRAPMVDCSFGESPIGPKKTMFFIKAYLKKLEWPGITNRDVMISTVDIEGFAEVMAKNIKWIFKLENEKAD